MKRFDSIIVLLTLAIFIALPMGTSHAISILYQATDLTDTTAGEDLWQYTYKVTDHTFSAYDGFSIYFDLGLYSKLEDFPPYVNDDWDPIGLQPDPFIPADGLYDAMALVDNPSLADPFTISFVWLGTGTPGAQFFELYDANWNITATGTTAPVPEPATLLLLATGLVGLAGFGKKHTTKTKDN